MKKLAVLFLLVAPFAFAAEIVMPRVNPALFIHRPQTDLEAVTLSDASLKEKLVKFLFDGDLIDHLGSKAFDPAAKFSDYYGHFGPFYRLMDLNNDGAPELIFNGVVSDADA